MECETSVGGGVITFACDLLRGHDGPHRAKENARSIRERELWEAESRGESRLSDLQGEAQTTAERYTVNPTPPPGTVKKVLMVDDPKVVCASCLEGVHIQCAHRAEVIAVMVDQVKDIVEFFCACFQAAPVPHGLDAAFAQRNGWPITDRVPVLRTSVPILSSSGTLRASGQTEVISQPIEDPVSSAPPVERDQASEPIKQREGDQSLPRSRELPSVQDRIVEKTQALYERGDMSDEELEIIRRGMEESKNHGMVRYGTVLHAWNGRDALRDVREEARDLYVYLSQIEEARDASRDQMIQYVIEEIREHVAVGGGADVVTVAGVAVDAIFKASAGPILEVET